MRSRKDSGVKMTWMEEGIAVSHQVERVQCSRKLLGIGGGCTCLRAAKRILQRAAHGYKSGVNWKNRTMSLRLSKFDFIPGESF
jgi:hypothetical protein